MRERSTDWYAPGRGNHTRPDQELNRQPRYVPRLGIKPTPLNLWDNAPRNWATLTREVMHSEVSPFVLFYCHYITKQWSSKIVFATYLFHLSLFTTLTCSLLYPEAMTRSVYEQRCGEDSGHWTPGFCYHVTRDSSSNSSTLRLCRIVQSVSPTTRCRHSQCCGAFFHKEMLPPKSWQALEE